MNAPALQTTFDPTTMIQPEFVLPEQAQTVTTVQKRGEFGLLWAVFSDGIRTYCQEILRGRRNSLTYREVERWIFRPDSDVVTSFRSLCDLFEIDVRRLRRRLLEFRDRPDPRVLDEFGRAA